MEIYYADEKDVQCYRDFVERPEDRKAPHAPREKDANKFANAYLFSDDNLRKTIFSDYKGNNNFNIRTLAHNFGVHPMFVNYWLRKAGHREIPRIHIDFMDGYR